MEEERRAPIIHEFAFAVDAQAQFLLDEPGLFWGVLVQALVISGLVPTGFSPNMERY